MMLMLMELIAYCATIHVVQHDPGTKLVTFLIGTSSSITLRLMEN